MGEPAGQLADNSTADEHLHEPVVFMQYGGRSAVFSTQLLLCAAISRWLLPPLLLWTGRMLTGRMLTVRHAITWILTSFPKVAPTRKKTDPLLIAAGMIADE